MPNHARVIHYLLKFIGGTLESLSIIRYHKGIDLPAMYLLKHRRNVAADRFRTTSKLNSCYATCRQTYPHLSVFPTGRSQIKRTKIIQSDGGTCKCRGLLHSTTRQRRRRWCLVGFPLKLLTNCTAKQQLSDKVATSNHLKG